MASPVPPYNTPPAKPHGTFDDDSKHSGDAVQGQDWWSRLSNAQIDLLRPLAAQLFEKLDDTLFDRSESSSQQFFEGMRILRKNRDVLTQTWFDNLADGWNSLRPQAPGAFRPPGGLRNGK